MSGLTERLVSPTAAIAILLVGAVLRAIQYGATTSLSMDEAALVVNIMERGWNALLFQPLLHAQIGPVGFLFLEKASISLAGHGEAAFRLFPFLMSLASLVLFWRVSTRYLSPPVMFAALVVFAVSPTLILYAGVAKQYSGDIAITLFLLWGTLRFLDGRVTTGQAALVGAVGGVALLCSYPAVLIACGLGVLLLLQRPRAGKTGSQVLTILAGWSVGAAIATWVSLSTLSPETGEYMKSGWEQGWVPPPWMGLREFLWIPIRLGSILTYSATGVEPTLESWPRIALVAFYMLLLSLGFVHLFRKDPERAAVLSIPVIVAIVAVVIRLLPLAGRVSLFLAPVLIIVCFAWVDQIRAWFSPRLRDAYAVVLVFAILPAVAGFARKPVPVELGGTRRVLEVVAAHWRPGDRLVVSRGVWTFRLVEYYGGLLGLEKWTPLDRLEGQHTTEEVLRSYLRRLDPYRGSPRVWFHLEGTTPCEDETILGYLNAIGTGLYSIEAHLEWGHRISGHLFDLSDPAHLATATADSYPLPSCGVTLRPVAGPGR